MPLRCALALSLLALPAGALQSTGTPQPVTSPVRDAGTYHVATGTWTRASTSTAQAGPEVLYDNTCTTGFYIELNPLDVAADSGRIPSTSSGGTGDSYVINGFNLAYCTLAPAPAPVVMAWWDCYEVCNSGPVLTGTPPVAALSLTGLPGAGPASPGCWVVTIDLANTTLTFNLNGDCDGVFDNVGTLDSFGWAYSTPGGQSGPMIAGDPQAVANTACGGVGDGTTFPGFNPGLPGTGLGNIDQYELASTTLPSGCYWFGGYSGANGLAGPGSNPWSGFYLQLQGEASGGGSFGASVCDCTGGNSPCGNVSGPMRGCPNSNPNGLGASLIGLGNISIANDTFSLSVVDAAPGKPGLILAGTAHLGPWGISTVPDNAGVFCIGGTTARGAVVFTDATGAASFPLFQGQPYGQSSLAGPGLTVTYSHWFRDPGTAAGCLNDGPGADFNFSNAWAVTWNP